MYGANVTISGGSGSGATATAIVNGGVVTALQMTNDGSGYAPALPLSGASNVTPSGFTATVNLAAGAVSGIDVSNSAGTITTTTASISGGGYSTVGVPGAVTVTGGKVTAIATGLLARATPLPQPLRSPVPEQLLRQQPRFRVARSLVIP